MSDCGLFLNKDSFPWTTRRSEPPNSRDPPEEAIAVGQRESQNEHNGEKERERA